MRPAAAKFKGGIELKGACAVRCETAPRAAQSRRGCQPIQRPAIVRRPSAAVSARVLIHDPHRVAAGLLVRAAASSSPRFSRVGQQVIERSESIGAFVETRMAALDGLFDHRAPDRFAAAAFLGQCFQGFDDQLQRIVEVRALVLGGCAVSGRGIAAGLGDRGAAGARCRGRPGRGGRAAPRLEGSLRTRSS